MKILFINGSPNKNGNTASLADELLKGQEYETLNLVDYKIYSICRYGNKYKRGCSALQKYIKKFFEMFKIKTG